MGRRALGPLACALLVSTAASAYQPPLPQGWVTDQAKKLSPDDVAFLNARLKAFQDETGAQVFVFIPSSLGSDSIEDVAYATFQTWKIGQKGKDNGVLLLWAPAERRVYIQTGKGVGGELPDVATFRIIQRMKPYLQADQGREALQVGTDAIMEAISGKPPPDALPRRPLGANAPRVQPVGPGEFIGMLSGIFCPLLIFFFFLFLAARRRRRGLLPFPIFWGGGGWGGGGGGWGGGGGGDGGGGFSGGGGGESGGGGSGDSY
jgi:uncharacterized protein